MGSAFAPSAANLFVNRSEQQYILNPTVNPFLYIYSNFIISLMTFFAFIHTLPLLKPSHIEGFKMN